MVVDRRIHQVLVDRLLEPLSDAVLAAAAVVPGERVLDIGCGCGTTTLALAAAGARVTGVDVSVPMLSHARQRAAGADNPQFLRADAAAQQFEAQHDVVFSRFGVMFFTDPVAAFVNLRAALRPGGRLCFLCWQRPDLNAWVAVPMAAVRPLIPVEDPVDPRAPGPFAFADPDYVSDVLTRAGFSVVRAEALERFIRLGQDPAAAAQFVARIGPVNRVLADMDESARKAVVDALRRALEPHLGAGGVELGAACWLVTAIA